MNYKIPKSIQIGSRKVKIKWVDALEHNEAALGRAVYGANTIELLKPSKAAPIDNETLAITLLHEYIHMILDTMGENLANENEKFIDLLANFLNQCLQLKIEN